MVDKNSDTPTPKRPSPKFFNRDSDGTVRLRLRFYPQDAALIEEAAGAMPLMDWIYSTLRNAAQQQVQEARSRRPPVGPPEKENQ